jgi:hypothetical protein
MVLGLELILISPFIANLLPSFAGKELTFCDSLAPCMDA